MLGDVTEAKMRLARNQRLRQNPQDRQSTTAKTYGIRLPESLIAPR